MLIKIVSNVAPKLGIKLAHLDHKVMHTVEHFGHVLVVAPLAYDHLHEAYGIVCLVLAIGFGITSAAAAIMKV